jgi:predicted nucleotidyltransferase
MGEGAVTERDDPRTFHRVLREAAGALRGADVPYVVIGSVALAHHGDAAPSEDVDLFLRSADEARALEALGRAGFEIDPTDQTWLSKAHRDGVLVDLIVQVTGGLVCDAETLDRAVSIEVDGDELALVSPEDQVVIEAASNSAEADSHWYHALSILHRSRLDWPYLVARARRSPRRVLSLLVYAQSDDLDVPADAVAELLALVYPSRSTATSR